MLLLEVNTERIRELARLLKPYRNTLRTLYKRDPQYIAIQSLIRARGCSEGCVLVLLNALISYQLSMPGEEYWFNFANYFAKKTVRDYYEVFRDFVSNYSPRLIVRKLSRVKEILRSGIILEIQKEPLKYCCNIKELVEKLASTLKADPGSKTLLFAAKMYGYVCDLCGVEPNYSELDIPVDYRNTLLAIGSCIVTIRKEDSTSRKIHACVKELLSRYSKIVQRAWIELCRELEVPCMHLDTFTWLVTGIIIKAGCNLEKAHFNLRDTLKIDLPLSLIQELTRCWCLLSVSREDRVTCKNRSDLVR